VSFLKYSAPLSHAECQQFVPFVHRLIGIACSVIRPLFLSGTLVHTKSDASPVTEADRGTERAMRALIHEHFPQHGILGEEFGQTTAATEKPRYRWVLDPIDGTRAFISHCFLFGTLIALERDTGQGWRPVLGAIAHPAAGVALIGHRDETRLYSAEGTQRRVRVRRCTRLSAATLLTSSHWSSREQNQTPNTEHIAKLASKAKLYRTWGDCFGYFSLATAGADIMLDPVLAYWDVAAIVPVVEGAGGQVTSWRGGNPLTEPSLIATAGTLHDHVLQQLHGTTEPHSH